MRPQKPAVAGKDIGDKAAAAAQRTAVRAEKAARKAAEKAAEKEAARQEKNDRALRQAAKVELPTHPQDDLLVIPVTQVPPRKRSANSAYDDRDGIKRRKLKEDSNSDDELSLLPWKRNRTLEQPPNPFDLGLEFDDQSIDPVEALGAFNKLSAEIREEILRYLLICGKHITVLKGWSFIFPREKPKLDLAIMSTCKVLRLQGLRILFGENTFVYHMCDPYPHHRFSKFHRFVFGAPIPINQYGHLIRHAGILLPVSRVSTQSPEFFHKAIQKFLPGHGLFEPANLHTLSIILLPGRTRPRGDDYETLMTQYLTPATKIISSLNVQYVRIVATNNTLSSRFEHIIDLRCCLWKRQEKAEELPAQDYEGVRRSFLQRVNLARARVYNIPTRVWELHVSDPEMASRMQPFWKLLDKTTYWDFRRNVKRGDLSNAASLPEDWVEDTEESVSQPTIKQNVKPRRSREEIIESTKTWLEGLPEGGYSSVGTEDSEGD
ncbi:hypothetical protein K449DRAFT_420042 [Hypoxylon sp. EC38]|nr:hypothetical protein K449DRAFT_420042 [Hypoxylon sp. EC38]